jgi:molybdate transport system substrate-binding protein
MKVRKIIGCWLVVALCGAGPAWAASVELLCPPSLRPVISELAPAFEAASGHKLSVRWEVMPTMKRQIDAGAVFDVAILTPELMDDAVKQGRLDGASRAVIAKTGAGLAVRKGARKPDISTVEAFQRTLLGAQSIGYTADGAAGNAFLAMLDRLGVATELKTRLKPLAGGAAVTPVARGEVEMTVTTIPGILEEPGAELVGPLPDALQSWVVYTAAVHAGAKEPAAGRALIAFLQTPAAKAVIRAKGVEPAP